MIPTIFSILSPDYIPLQDRVFLALVDGIVGNGMEPWFWA
jgi:hypothetical protein